MYQNFFIVFLPAIGFSSLFFGVATFLVLLLLIAQMYFAFFMELAIQQQANLSVCVWECPSEREWDAEGEKVLFHSPLAVTFSYCS